MKKANQLKNVLITGGAGFIGRPLVRKLLDRGYCVTVVDNFSYGQPELLPSDDRLTVVQADIREYSRLTRIMRELKPWAVVHLAALHYIPYCIEHPGETYEVNVTGTRNLLEAVSTLEDKPHFVFSSSAAVYQDSVEKLRETCPIDPIDVYGETKVEGEHMVKDYCAQFDIGFTVLRLFNVYGPGDNMPHLIPNIVRQLKNGDNIQLGNLLPKRDLVYVDDVAEAFAMSVDARKPIGIYNVGTGFEYSPEEVVNSLENILQSHKQERRLGVTSAAAFQRASDRMHLVCINDALRNDLGWKPNHSLLAGLEELLYSEHILSKSRFVSFFYRLAPLSRFALII